MDNKEMKKQDETKASLFAALASATKDLTAVKKNEKSFSGKYADMKAILSVVNPVLEKNRLSICHTVSISENRYTLKSMLCHSSGEYIESSIPLLMPKQDMQSLGAAITYARRYATQAFLNLAVADFDDDGDSIKGTPVAAKTVRRVAPSQEASRKLSEDQVNELYELVDGDFSLIGRILSFNQADKLENVPAENFVRIKNYIQKYKEKAVNE